MGEKKFYKQTRIVTSLEDAKACVSELHELGKRLFMLAWEKGWHKELALYSMQAKEGKANESNGS